MPTAIDRLVACAACATAIGMPAGCSPKPPAEVDRVRIEDRLLEPADRQFALQPFEDQARAAVVRQHTLFDYHFESGSTDLTPLGRRDLRWLTDAMLRDGGTICIPRGQAAPKLHAARMAAVRRGLASRGIQEDRVSLADALPGGGGVDSLEALVIREQVRKIPFEVPTGSVLSPTGGESTVSSEIGGNQ